MPDYADHTEATMVDQTERTMRTAEIVRETGLTKWTVRRLIDSGELPGYSIPGSLHRRVRESDVRALVERLRSGVVYAGGVRVST
jgi:excisionase family DNA binding protein